MTHSGITKENILDNIKIEVQTAFKTQEDLQDSWKKTANKYQVRLSYFHKNYVTDYFMGCALTRKPSQKDVLSSMLLDDVSCISFHDFCMEFGYDDDSIKSLKVYEACQKETQALHDMFDAEEIEILRELLEDY